MRALLNGPSEWLAPAVTTAIPEGTALSVDAVTITNGVAEVALSDNVLSLNDGQRTLMAAQVLYTLQPTGIQGVAFTVDQQPYAIPGADPGTFVVSLDSRFEGFDPIPPGVVDSLYSVRAGKLEVTLLIVDPAQSNACPRPAGSGSLADRSAGRLRDGRRHRGRHRRGYGAAPSRGRQMERSVPSSMASATCCSPSSPGSPACRPSAALRVDSSCGSSGRTGSPRSTRPFSAEARSRPSPSVRTECGWP